jgi:hypothetical protein
MIRRQLSAALLATFVAAALPAITSAHTAKPAIQSVRVGYFGTADIAHRLNVFVYSTSQPRAGTRVTVCLRGVCKRAVGHNAKLAWYSASFKTAPMWMGDPVMFTAVASNSAGQAKATVTKGLQCMHNNGSVPHN